MIFLVTGGTGFLGSHLIRGLLASGHQVVLLKRKTSDVLRIEPLLSKLKAVFDIESGLDLPFTKGQIDGIIHCATDYGRKNSDPLQITQANLILPLSLLNLAVKNRVKVFINTDTLLDKRVNEYSYQKNNLRNG